VVGGTVAWKETGGRVGSVTGLSAEAVVLVDLARDLTAAAAGVRVVFVGGRGRVEGGDGEGRG
jgi:hypothetical protein